MIEPPWSKRRSCLFIVDYPAGYSIADSELLKPTVKIGESQATPIESGALKLGIGPKIVVIVPNKLPF